MSSSSMLAAHFDKVGPMASQVAPERSINPPPIFKYVGPFYDSDDEDMSNYQVTITIDSIDGQPFVARPQSQYLKTQGVQETRKLSYTYGCFMCLSGVQFTRRAVGVRVVLRGTLYRHSFERGVVKLGSVLLRPINVVEDGLSVVSGPKDEKEEEYKEERIDGTSQSERRTQGSLRLR